MSIHDSTVMMAINDSMSENRIARVTLPSFGDLTGALVGQDYDYAEREPGVYDVWSMGSDEWEWRLRVTVERDDDEHADTWDFGDYWDAVFGSYRSAARVVSEFDLDPSDRRGLDEWIGTCEAGAWLAYGGLSDMPESWGRFHDEALDRLCAVEEG